MQRATSGLERSVVKWVSQVAVSVGATLIATMIYGALPRASVPAASAPEMTSGGKFAARVEPASTIAYDGLDTMPLPHVATPAIPAAFLGVPVAVGAEPVDAAPGGMGQIRQAIWDGAVPIAGPDRGVKRAAKPALHGEAKRNAGSLERPQLISLVTLETPSEVTKADDGLLPKVVSTARDAWSVTTSAGGSLLSRLIP